MSIVIYKYAKNIPRILFCTLRMLSEALMVRTSYLPCGLAGQIGSSVYKQLS